VQWIIDIAIGGILVAAIVIALGIEAEDPSWEERWLDLSTADRARLAAAARSGALLPDPDEIDLAAGYARRYRGRNSRERLGFISVPLGAALIVAGLVTDNAILVVFGVFFGAGGLWGLSHSLQLDRNLREAISRDHRP
jgi:hypothetical protein